MKVEKEIIIIKLSFWKRLSNARETVEQPARKEPREERKEAQTLLENLRYIISTVQEARPKHLQVNQGHRSNQARNDPMPGNTHIAAKPNEMLEQILELPDRVAEQGYP